MNSTLLKELVDTGDAFERVYPSPADQTLPNFLAWAGAQQAGSAALIEAPSYTYYADDVPVLQTLIAQFLTKAYRFLRVYVRKALDTAPLLTFDDFISLVYLAERGNMSKTELVEATVNEKTSGMLVIKRLIEKGFIAQTDDEQDKRSHRLTITVEGLAMLRAVQPAINQATAMLKGDLSIAEQQQLGNLLARLDKFHNPLFRHRKEASLDELLQLVGHAPNA